MGHLRAARLAASAFGLFLLCDFAQALSLGEMQQQSALGEPFRVRLPYQLARDEEIEPECIRLRSARSEAGFDMPVMPLARARLEASGGRSYIILESSERVNEPILWLSVEVACRGASLLSREFIVLLDLPKPAARPAARTGGQDTAAREGAVAVAEPAQRPAAAAVAKALVPSPTASPQMPSSSSSGKPEPTSPSGEKRVTPPATQPAATIAASPPALRTPREVRNAPAQRKAPRDMLRLSASGDEPDARRDNDSKQCCMRLSYSLTEKSPDSTSDAEREILRREYHERMAEGDLVPRILTLQDSTARQRREIAQLSGDLRSSEVRRVEEVRAARLSMLAYGALATVIAGAALWVRKRRGRRHPFQASMFDGFATDSARVEPSPKPESHAERATPEYEMQAAALEEPARAYEPSTAGAVAVALANREPEAVPDRYVPEYERTQKVFLADLRPSRDEDVAKAPHSLPEVAGTDPGAGLEYSPSFVEVAADPDARAPALDVDLSLDGDRPPDEIVGLDFKLDLPLEPEPVTVPGSGPATVAALSVVEPSEGLAANFFDVVDPAFGAKAEKVVAPTSAPLELDAGSTAPAGVLGLSLMPAEPGTGSVGQDEPAIDPVFAARRAAEYRTAYFFERFPEIAAGGLSLDKPASVIEVARIVYQEDLDVPRAVGLLQMALYANTGHAGLWLALLEIFSLEGLRLEFSDLARQYRETFSRTNEHWPMIAKLGREMEEGNSLYSAKDLPAADERRPNWLNAQLDMTSHMLALDLRADLRVAVAQ